VLGDADRPGGHPEGGGGLVGAHADGDAQGEDLALLCRQLLHERHRGRGVVAHDGQGLGRGPVVGAVGQVRHGRGCAHRGALGVGELARGDRVDEGLEGQAALLVGRQGRHDSHAHLLRDVLGSVLGAEAAEADAGVPQSHVPDTGQEHLARVGVTRGERRKLTKRWSVHPLHRTNTTRRYAGVCGPPKTHESRRPPELSSVLVTPSSAPRSSWSGRPGAHPC
jgi:hypothetical protein